MLRPDRPEVWITLAALGVVVVTLLALGYANRYPPARPHGVPSSAQWAGGMDGGEWVDCSAETGRYNDCQVYSEKGDLIWKSAFTLKDLDRAATRSELRYRYVKGTTILLQEGLALVPLSSPTQ